MKRPHNLIRPSNFNQVRFRQLYAAYNTEAYEKVKGEWIEYARQKLPYLDKLLAKNGYVTGKLSYVDIEVFDFFLVIGVFAPELLKEHPNIARHFQTINSLPQIQNYRNGKGKGEFFYSNVSISIS